VDHIPVHIGAEALKRILYDAVIPKWNRWADNFPLRVDQIMMRDKLWVLLKPTAPDRNAIARHFFKRGKKGIQIFKTGKTVIYFHIPNEVYSSVIEKKADDELGIEQRAVTNGEVEYIPSDVADFTVRGFIQF
jgi:hypothetical protein